MRFIFSKSFLIRGQFAPSESPAFLRKTKLKDLKLKDGTLTFSAERKLPGMGDAITVEYKLTIDGDQLKGKGAAEFGGEKREYEIKAKRQKNDK